MASFIWQFSIWEYHKLRACFVLKFLNVLCELRWLQVCQLWVTQKRGKHVGESLRILVSDWVIQKRGKHNSHSMTSQMAWMFYQVIPNSDFWLKTSKVTDFKMWCSPMDNKTICQAYICMWYTGCSCFNWPHFSRHAPFYRPITIIYSTSILFAILW
jgi:hypothetical protein